MEITENELAEAAGWKAWKAGRDIHKRGGVTDAQFVNGLYTGVQNIGGRTKHPKVKVNSRTDIVTTCGCIENRHSGALCAHGVAVVLAVLDDSTSAPEETPGVIVDSGDSVRLLLPPVWQKLLKSGKNLPVRWEKTASGVPAKVLGLSEKLQQEVGLAQLPAAKVQEVLRAGTERDQSVWVENKGGEPSALTLSDRLPRLRSHIQKEDKHFKIELKKASGLSTWVGGLMGDNSIYLCQLGRRDEWVGTLIAGHALTISTEDFVRDIEWFDCFCDFGEEMEATGLTVDDAHVRGHIVFKGGSRNLHATVSSEWTDSDGNVIEGARIGSLSGAGMEWYRIVPGEVAPETELMEAGFQKSSAQVYELRDEGLIAEFLAHQLPVIEQTHSVELSTPLRNYREMLAPLRPDIVLQDQGEDWTGFDLGYRAPGSDRLSLDQVRKLIASGRKTVKMKTGQTAVLASDDLRNLEELLRDLDPEQDSSGYRATTAQGRYLAEYARTQGLGLSGKASELKEVNLTERLPELSQKLRSYQSEGVAFLLKSVEATGAALLADDMGLGKTLQSLAVMKALGAETPFLVICPTSLIGTWQKEAEKWLPEWTSLVLHGSGREAKYENVSSSQIVITSFALAARDLDKLRDIQWSGIFVDEASIMRNPDTQSAKAIAALKAKVRVALTGTPIENGVGDVWSIFRFLLPGYLGPRKDFKERYEKPVSAGIADKATMARLRSRLSPFMLRRLKTEVAKDLPAKIICVRSCPMTSAQSDVYHSLLKDGQAVIEEFATDKQAARMQVLTLLLRLRQAASEPRLLGLDEKSVSGKMESLDELLDEALNGGHKVLIFSQFTTMLDLIGQSLEEKKIVFCKLTGATANRQREVDRFQRKDGPKVFLISLKAGGYGLTLTEADTVIHVDPWWNPAVEAQATDRAHRIGQTRPVTVYKLITEGTVEEKILALQAKKSEILAGAFDESAPVMSGLSDSDLMDVLEV